MIVLLKEDTSGTSIRGFYPCDSEGNITKLLEFNENGTYRLGKTDFKDTEEQIKYIDRILEISFGNLELLELSLKYLSGCESIKDVEFIEELKKEIRELKHGR